MTVKNKDTVVNTEEKVETKISKLGIDKKNQIGFQTVKTTRKFFLIKSKKIVK